MSNPIVSSVARVLVVEDNSDDQEILLRQLRKMNFHDYVKFVTNAEKALTLLTTENKEVILAELCVIFLDLNLPGMGGIELLKKIRSEPLTDKLPVVVMTSSNNPRDLEECQRLQVLKFVPKPVTYQAFSMAVASVFHLPNTTPGKLSARDGE